MRILRPTKTQWADEAYWENIPRPCMFIKDIGQTDAELLALIECSRLHDDEYTSENAQNCDTLIVNPGILTSPPGIFFSERGFMEPDSKCVARKAKSIALRSQLEEAGLVGGAE